MNRENEIDFPCAPNWVSYYASLGMTPDYPHGYYERPREDDVQEMVEGAIVSILERVEERLNLYQGQLAYLQNKILEKPKYQKPEPKKPGLKRIEI